MDKNQLVHKFTYGAKPYFYSKSGHCICREPDRSVQPVKNGSMPDINIRVMWLNLTTACNLSCRYCFNPEAKDRRQGKEVRQMTPEIARQAVIMLSKLWALNPNTNPAGIIFFGGEPLLNFKLLEYVVHFGREWTRLSGVPFNFGLATNGTLLNERIARLFAHEGFHVHVSLDGPQPLHDSFRPFASGKGSHGTIVKNLFYLSDTPGIRLNARATLGLSDFKVDEIIRFFCNLGFKKVFLKTISGFNEANIDDASATFKALHAQLDDIAREVLRARRQRVRVFLFEEHIQSLINRSWRRFVCMAGSGAVSIDTDGSIYPCHRFHGNPEFKLGRVGEEADMCIPGIFATLTPENIEECRSCWAANFCLGCCPAESAAFGKKLGKPHEYWCMAKKLEAEISLKVAVGLGLFHT